MEGKELKQLRKSLGLSLAKAARQVEVSPRTFARWESGVQHIPEGAVKLFKMLNGLDYSAITEIKRLMKLMNNMAHD